MSEVVMNDKMDSGLKQIVSEIQVTVDNYKSIDCIALLGYVKIKLELDWNNEFNIIKRYLELNYNPKSKIKRLDIFTVWACAEFLYAARRYYIAHYFLGNFDVVQLQADEKILAALLCAKDGKYRNVKRLIKELKHSSAEQNDLNEKDCCYEAMMIYFLTEIEKYGISTKELYENRLNWLITNKDRCPYCQQLKNDWFCAGKNQTDIAMMFSLVLNKPELKNYYHQGIELCFEYLGRDNFRSKALALWTLVRVIEYESDTIEIETAIQYYLQRMNFPNIAQLFADDYNGGVKLGFISLKETCYFAMPILNFLKKKDGIEVRVCYDYLDQDAINNICNWADVVWVEWAHRAAKEVLKFKRNCKILIRFHRYELKYIDTLRWENADYVWFVNRDVMEEFLRRNIRINFQIFFMPNAVDISKIVFNQQHKGKRLVAYSPDFRPIKNYLYAVQLLKRLNELASGFSLTIKASSKVYLGEYEECKRFVDKYNLPVTIIDTDVNMEDIPNIQIANKLLKGKDFILSVSNYECFHYAFAEGLASGCFGVCRADRNGYPDDFWEPYVCQDLEAMANRIIELTKLKPEEKQSMSLQNRKYIEGRFAPERIANGLLHYLDAVKNNNTGERVDGPRVGIVIPTYNHAHYLEEALDSLLDGSYKNIFILVIDDGSTDNTQEVLEKYRDRIFFIFNQHVGSHVNRDIGLKIMQYLGVDYLSFPCADDIYHKNYIKAMVAEAEAKQALVVYPRFSYYNQREKKVIDTLPFYPHDKEVLLNERCYICDHCLASKEVFDLLGWELNWSDYGAYCFFDLWVRLTERPEWDNRIIGLNKVLFKYRRYPESLSVTKSDNRPSDLKQRVLDAHVKREQAELQQNKKDQLLDSDTDMDMQDSSWEEFSVGGSRHQTVKFQNDWKVIEIGGGANPNPRANVITNFQSEENQSGKKIKVLSNAKMVECDVQNMRQFSDKEFDYCICCHVLEHVADPIKACGEIQRIAKQGYIECPSYIAELLLGHDCHRWVISCQQSAISNQQKSKLVFRRKLPEEIDRYGDFFKDLFYKDNPIQKRFIENWFQYWQYGYVCFEWKTDFEVEAIK